MPPSAHYSSRLTEIAAASDTLEWPWETIGIYFLRISPLVTMRFYFDGSEGREDNDDRWLTLAGFAAGDTFWNVFYKQWNHMLHERYPIVPYCPYVGTAPGKDPFERVNGWTDDRVLSLVHDAVDLLRDMDQTAFCSFVCMINISACERRNIARMQHTVTGIYLRLLVCPSLFQVVCDRLPA